VRQPIATPCIDICAMDSSSGLCLGCGRTLDEIARWGTMREHERAAVMQELEARKAALLTTRC
jgi:predicted Fe-S protein YdhL (DUF1289 family)